MKRNELMVVSGIAAAVALVAGFYFASRKRRSSKVSEPVAQQEDNLVDIEFEKFRKTLSPRDLDSFDTAYSELGRLCLQYLSEDSYHQIGCIILSSVRLRNLIDAAQSRNQTDEVLKYTRMLIEGTSDVLAAALREMTTHLSPELREQINQESNVLRAFIMDGVARQEYSHYQYYDQEKIMVQ